MAERGIAARRAGIRFEQEVARWFGTSTTRNTRPGIHDDAGDVVLPGHFVECKAHTRLRIGEWWRKLALAVAGTTLEPVLIVKVWGQTVGAADVYERDPETGLWADPQRLDEWWPHDT